MPDGQGKNLRINLQHPKIRGFLPHSRHRSDDRPSATKAAVPISTVIENLAQNARVQANNSSGYVMDVGKSEARVCNRPMLVWISPMGSRPGRMFRSVPSIAIGATALLVGGQPTGAHPNPPASRDESTRIGDEPLSLGRDPTRVHYEPMLVCEKGTRVYHKPMLVCDTQTFLARHRRS